MTQILDRNTRAKDKLSRIPVKVVKNDTPLQKPSWIKTRLPSGQQAQQVKNLTQLLKEQGLVTVCHEAACPNLPECYGKGTATFMIMGDRCTRRCSFCDVAHGRPDPLNTEEPKKLAQTIQVMQLKYVVITSVDRDDLRDGGAQHFVECIQETRARSPNIQIEILVPNFRGRLDKALEILGHAPPDVFNHNIETVPELYRAARPGSDYQHSLKLLQDFKKQHPHIPTKSGLMLGLGETDEQVLQVLKDLSAHQVDRITIGQYLQPTRHHLPVSRYVSPDTFAHFKKVADDMGFEHTASGPLVRSSYHADKQAAGEIVS